MYFTIENETLKIITTDTRKNILLENSPIILSSNN